MSRPTFVCLPGASHSPEIYDAVKAGLAAHGYITIALALPSINAVPAKYDFTEDVQVIRETVVGLVEANREVIVVMHAYSGIPGTDALRGLGKREREAQGLRGGVTRLVFIMAWIPKEGFQGAPRGDVAAMYPWMRTNAEAGIATIDPTMAAEVFYNDLPRPTAEYWVARLQTQSIGVFWSRTTYAAWRFIPSTYVLCGQDQCITLAYGEMMLAAAQESRPNAIDMVERCDEAGHCPMLSQPEWTVGMLRRAAGERGVAG